MRMKNRCSILVCCLLFLLSSHCSVAQNKSRMELYPSLNTGYGFLSYKLQQFDNGSSVKYYNTNYTLGIQLNLDIKLAENASVQLYGGYTKWQTADLFPIGVMLKPKINQKPNELFFKMGGGYSLGKRYSDKNEPWSATSMPSDYGTGKMHLQIGLEKNYHVLKSAHFSVGFLLSMQVIKSYAALRSRGGLETKQSYYIPYKFASLTFAYHFRS